MKKCTLNSNWSKSNHRISVLSGIVAIAMLLVTTGCTNPESDQTLEPAESTTDVTSTVDANMRVSDKCESVSQDLTDRFNAYVATYIDGDIDEMYSFWSPGYYEFTPAAYKNREEMLENMTLFYANGGKLSYTWQLLERNIHNDVAYDIGSYDNLGEVSGTQFTINGYYFMRWIKGPDGLWSVDKDVNGPRGSSPEVNPNAAVAATCYKQGSHNGSTDAINQAITNRFDSYTKALTAGNADKAYTFWTDDFHFYGDGLNTDRDGLYQYYLQFFQTGSIASSNANLNNRFIHGNIAYDIIFFDEAEVVNGVQSVKKSHYVIRWEKRNGEWFINRLMNLARL